jgi:hypothetical protein
MREPVDKPVDIADGTTPIELGPPSEEPPVSLDPDRDDAERNAAAGGWDGANEQIENDFEVEQLRREQETARDGGEAAGDEGAGDEGAGDEDEDVPLT